MVGRGRRDEIGSAGMLTTTHEFQNESFKWAMHFCVASVFKDDSNRCTFIVDVENCQWPCGVARKSYIRDYATIGTLSAVPCCSSCVIHSTPDKVEPANVECAKADLENKKGFEIISPSNEHFAVV